jgi:hypothetical protein
MKKQKIALGKLSLSKERITNLNAEAQGDVLGGGPISVNIACQVTLQINCQQTIFCATRTPACYITRVPVCSPLTVGAGCPPQSLVCNETLACGGTTGF